MSVKVEDIIVEEVEVKYIVISPYHGQDTFEAFSIAVQHKHDRGVDNNTLEGIIDGVMGYGREVDLKEVRDIIKSSLEKSIELLTLTTSDHRYHQGAVATLRDLDNILRLH